MKTKDKGVYEAPTSEVMEMNMQNVVCTSPLVMYFLTDTTNPSSEIDWGRTTYGDATTGTWD